MNSNKTDDFLSTDDLMAGAAASTFLINDAATILPRAVVAKLRAYFAGAAANVLEVNCLV